MLFARALQERGAGLGGALEPPLKDLAVLGQIMGWALPLMSLLDIPVK